MIAPAQEQVFDVITNAVSESAITIITGENGYGQLETVSAALSVKTDWTVISDDGDWFTGGYLAGFQQIIEQSLAWCRNFSPALIEQYQQTLKRLYPLLDLPQFTVPKDLTNTASKDERTRFYHHEYQNKLLVGLSEFLIQTIKTQDIRIILIIDRASRLSPTAQNLIKTLCRLKGGAEAFKFVLLDYNQSLFFENARELSIGRYSKTDIINALALDDEIPAEKIHQIYMASGGNVALAKAVVACDNAGIPVVGYINTKSHIDLYLSTLSLDNRQQLLVEFISGNCTSNDCIAIRNYETFDPDEVDNEHLRHHSQCMTNYYLGEAPLITLHAQSIRDKRKRLEALAEPSEILKSIGLYDTWFSYYAMIFADQDLRKHGSGNDPVNAAFINAAFVLYSLGCGKVSVPYLEEFYHSFPKSKYTPTVLYAQSMTYGRYQQPVNLPLAEEYAQRNLKIIEDDFTGYEKYHYIKVFAENAYAYIKARQGKYAEALQLCTEGNRKMLEIYGDNRFKLHQSILIYNTSQVYEIVKDYDRAEKQLRLAISYDPFYGEYYNDLGNLLSKIDGRETDALDAYARAIELCPPSYEAHLNRGVLLTRLGNTIDALTDFKRALEIKPNEVRAYFEMGNVHLGKGDYSSALEAYQAAASIDANNPDLQSNLGLALSELGSSAESIVHYQEAIKLQPKHALSHNNLAIELFNVGRVVEALDHANLAVEIGGDSDYVETRDFIVNHKVA